MEETPVSRQFAAFVEALRFESLPPHVAEMAKARVLDSIGTAIEARSLPVPMTALKWVGRNRGEATVFGHAMRVPAVDAALVNATLINGCTHDDYVYKSHAGALTIPAAFAIAEEEGRSGRELLAGVVAGYEINSRAYLGAPGMLPAFRATGVAGAVGAAAAAGKLLRLPAPALGNALGLAAMFASGFGEGFHYGTMDVKFNVGWACRSGVSAAMLARHGATSAPTVFEGVSGYFKAFGRTAQHAQAATQGLGQRFLLEDVTYKECPVCICVQTPVYLARTLVQQRKLDPARIRKVSVKGPRGNYENPGYQNLPPFGSALAARISAPFCVAAALLGRPVQAYEYYDHYTDPEVLALVERIELVPPTDDDSERVTLVVDYDGERLAGEGIDMDTLRPTTEKIVAKFRTVAGDFLGARTEQVIATVLALDEVRDLRELTDLVRAPGTTAQGARELTT